MAFARRPLAIEQQDFQRVRNAAAKHLSGELRLDGTTVKVTDFLADLDAALATFGAARVAQAALQQAQADRAQAIASMRTRMGNLKTYLQATLSKTNPRLAAFGFLAQVRKPLSSEQRVLKAAKAPHPQCSRNEGIEAEAGDHGRGAPGVAARRR